jgi:hypothetical protein
MYQAAGPEDGRQQVKYLRKLMKSMPRRLEDVTSRHGNPTKY